MSSLACRVQELIEGEHIDTLLEGDTVPVLEVIEAMAAAETGALIAQACALGALAANAPAEMAGRLKAFGAHVGMAFQLVDDILGIWGDPETTGKPVYSDLRSCKKSLPVAAALAACGPDADRLRALYCRAAPFTDGELAEVAGLVEGAGGRRWAVEAAARAHAGAHGMPRVAGRRGPSGHCRPGHPAQPLTSGDTSKDGPRWPRPYARGARPCAYRGRGAGLPVRWPWRIWAM